MRTSRTDDYEMPESVVKGIHASAELMHQNFEDGEWLTSEEAARQIGVSIYSLKAYSIDRKIPYEIRGRERVFKAEVCDEVRELRTKHTSQTWWHFTSWQQPTSKPTRAIAHVSTRVNTEPETNEDAEDLLKLVARARELAEKNRPLEALGMLWVLADSLEEMLT